MLNLQLPEGGAQFDAAVFDQAGAFVQVGPREECEQKAEEIGGLYCWIVDGRAIIRSDFERDTITININGAQTDVPVGAIAYKYADPVEDARWVYTQSDLDDISREDPSLLVMVED